MNLKSDKFIMGYIDKELVVSEYDEVERQLSSSDKQFFENEAVFEDRLADSLSQPIKCPDNLWENINKQATEKKKYNFRFLFTMVASIAIFSSILFAFLSNSNISNEKIIENNIKRIFPKEPNLTSIDAIKQAFANSNLNIAFNMKKGQCVHPKCKSRSMATGCCLQSLGAQEMKDCFVLGFYCPGCKMGTKVEIYKNKIKLAKKENQESRIIAGYQVVITGKHNREEIFNILTKKEVI